MGEIDLNGYLVVSIEGFHWAYGGIGRGDLEFSNGMRQSAGDVGLSGRHYVETSAPASRGRKHGWVRDSAFNWRADTALSSSLW